MTNKKEKRQPKIKDPFVLHEGHWYMLPDWYSRHRRHGQVMLLHPLEGEEIDKLLYLREGHLSEAYGRILPMVQNRALIPVVDPGDDE